MEAHDNTNTSRKRSKKPVTGASDKLDVCEMESSNENENIDTNKKNSKDASIELDVCEMESSSESFDYNVLREAGESTINAEWSMTASTSRDSETSVDIDILRECCANPSETLKDKDDFIVLESTIDGNISNFNPDLTKSMSMRKTTAFQKKHKPSSPSVSHFFENILDDDSQMEVTQNSICLSRFQKRKRFLPPNDDDFNEVYKSDNSGMNSMEVSMNSPKCRFSKKNIDKSCLDVPNYSLSSAVDNSVADDSNASKKKESVVFKVPSDSLLINETTKNVTDVSKTEVMTHKFARKSVGVVDSVFENIINDSSVSSDFASSNEKTSLNNSSVSDINRISLYTADMSSLNHTYNIPNCNSTQIAPSSQSIKKSGEVINTTQKQPINETYILENDLESTNSTSNESLDLVNAKNTMTDTYTVENNVNETYTRSKSSLISVNKSINTLADMSNIYNESKSSTRKPHYIRKLKLDSEPQHDDYITNNDSLDSTVNYEMNDTENSKCKRFKSKKSFQDVDSVIFENISISRRESEMSTSENADISNNIHNVSDMPVETSNSKDLLETSNKSQSKQNMEKSTNESITLRSNSGEHSESNDNLSEIPLMLKYNRSESFYQPSTKFRFSQKLGRLSLSFQENNLNLKEVNKTFEEIASVSLPPIPNISKAEVANCHESSLRQNTTFGLSQSPAHRFTSKPNFDAHSEVFSGLIIDKSNISTSLDGSQNVKFKKRPNISEDHSNMFDGLISCSQESSTSTSKLNPQIENGLSSNSHVDITSNNLSISKSPLSNIVTSNQSISSTYQFNDSLPGLSQTPTRPFTEKHDVDVNSGVFNDLISMSIDSNKSLNKSENTKFKKIKLSIAHSDIFENVIGSSQESNSTLTQNKSSCHSVLQDQSKTVGDEMSMFANDDELVSFTPDNFTKTLDDNTSLSVEKGLKCSSDELIGLNNISSLKQTKVGSEKESSKLSNNSIDNDKSNSINVTIPGVSISNNTNCEKNNSLRSDDSINNYSLSNVTAGLLINDFTPNIRQTRSTSKSILTHNVTVTHSPKDKTINLSTISTRSSKRSKSIISNKEESTLLNTYIESLENNESKSEPERSVRSIHSTSIDSEREGLTSFNSTEKSLESSVLLCNQSNRTTSSIHSTSVASTNEGLTLMNTTAGSMEISGNKSLHNQSNRTTSSIHSTSVGSTNEGLTLMNTTAGSMEVSGNKSLRNQSNRTTSSIHSTSVASTNEELTLMNTTAGSMEGNGNKSLCNESNRTTSSTHSTSVASFNEGLPLLNTTAGSLEGNGNKSLRNRSNKTTSSIHSKSVASTNEGLPLLNTTAGSLEGNGNKSLRNRSNKTTSSIHSKSVASTNEGLILMNTTAGSMEGNGNKSLRNESNRTTSSTHSTSVASFNEGLPLLNTTAGSLEGNGNKSLRNQSNKITSSIHSASTASNNKELILPNISTKSLKNNESLNIQQKVSKSNYSLRKSTQGISNVSNQPSMVENDMKNVNEVSLCSPKQKTHSFNKEKTLITVDSISEKNISSSKRLTRSSSKSLVVSDNIDNSVSNKTVTYNNSLIAENSLKNKSINSTKTYKMITVSNKESDQASNSDSLSSNNNISKQVSVKKDLSGHNNETTTSNSNLKNDSSTDLVLQTNEQSVRSTRSTRSTRLSSRALSIPNTSFISSLSNNSSIDNMSIANNQEMVSVSENVHVKNEINRVQLSTSLITKRVSNTSLDSSLQVSVQLNPSVTYNNVENESDDSIFWTTLSQDSANKSTSQTLVNENHTAINNSLVIAHRIANKIGIMSTNKRKVSHPGVFELEEHMDGPLTRSFFKQPSVRSPSILTRAFAGNDSNESISFSQTFCDNIDPTQIEESVIEKFKSLYNKESWITKLLYNFLDRKLKPRYSIYSLKYAEKFIKYLASILKQVRSENVDLQLFTDMLRYHMARYGIIKDTCDYMGFLTDYIPRPYYDKLTPGWDLQTSVVKFDPLKYYVPIMEDEEFLNNILENLNVT